MTRRRAGGKARNGVKRSHALSQVAALWGYLEPRSLDEKSSRAFQTAWGSGAA